MEKILVAVVIVLLLYVAGNAFYIVLKTYQEDDEFHHPTLEILPVHWIMDFLLFISRKLAPDHYFVALFKTLSFLYGLFIVGIIILILSFFFF
ncbi:hypothetical protein [Rossellomorea marisflavi]|uniref:hypothetical protein n=1 Tax=Rossellomorea marisflavi TaxID=189381 RepID=UPI0034593938